MRSAPKSWSKYTTLTPFPSLHDVIHECFLKVYNKSQQDLKGPLRGAFTENYLSGLECMHAKMIKGSN